MQTLVSAGQTSLQCVHEDMATSDNAVGASVAASSLKSVWCVWAIKTKDGGKRQTQILALKQGKKLHLNLTLYKFKN